LQASDHATQAVDLGLLVRKVRRNWFLNRNVGISLVGRCSAMP